MTPEDREEIGTIVQQAISANNHVIFDALRASEEHVDNRFDGIERRIDGIERRLDHISERVDSFGQILLTMDARLAALTRANEHVQKDHGGILETQAAQQRAIDTLAARVARLEAQKQ